MRLRHVLVLLSIVSATSIGAFGLHPVIALPRAKETGRGTSWSLSNEVNFRRDVDLPSDAAYIRYLHAHPWLADPSSSARYGALLTTDEMRMMSESEAVTRVASAVQRYEARHARRVFGGVYLTDLGSGGIVHVGFVNDRAGHLSQLRAIFAYPKRLRAFAVRNSLEALDRLHRRIDRNFSKLRARGINVTDVATSIQHNAIEVGVYPISSRAISIITHLFGRRALRVIEGSPITVASRDTVYPPYQAGLELRSPIGLKTLVCTSNFLIWDWESSSLIGPQQRVYYAFTAGHCVDGGGSAWVSGSPSQVVGAPSPAVTSKVQALMAGVSLSQIKGTPAFAPIRQETTSAPTSRVSKVSPMTWWGRPSACLVGPPDTSAAPSGIETSR